MLFIKETFSLIKNMKLKIIPKYILILIFLLATQAINASSETKVGFIFDGPSPLNEETLALLKKEIKAISEGEFLVSFPENKTITSNWNYESIKSSIDSMLSDPNVDIIITPGIISSYEIAIRKNLSKPVIAPSIIDHKIQGVPITQEGTSGVHNLSYISGGSVIEREFEVFYEIVKFKKLAYIFMDFIPEKFPKLIENVLESSQKIGVELEFIPAKSSADEVLTLMSDDVDAVYISPLLTFSVNELTILINGINNRKLPSFSLMGRKEVEKGALMGLNPETDSPRVARRVALNFQEILLGTDAANIQVEFKKHEQLTINMETARKINFYPGWQWLTEADLLNEDIKGKERKINLKSAVTEAVRVNLDLLTAESAVSAGAENIRLAFSELLPQSQTFLDYTVIDKDRAESSFGTQPEKSLKGSIGVDQVIFNEPLLANLKVQKQLQKARVFDKNSVRLDIIQATSIAYFNILKAKTFERIRKENLKLTKSNLELARIRKEIGVASPAEVFRWESELSQNRIDVVNSEAETKKRQVLLQRLLHRPLNELFDTSEDDINDPMLLGNDPRLDPYIDNPGSFKIFMDYMVQVGLSQSPEIESLSSQIKAQDRILKSTQRAFWLPTLSFGAEISERFEDSGAGTEIDINIPGIEAPDDTEWIILFSARFPLFRGGAKIAEYKQAREQLASLRLERASTKEKVEENIRNNLYDASASHPSIEFSKNASVASKKNLDLVTDSYSEGIVSILDLLDAQNEALSSELIAASAVYDFLIDLMNIQRAIGKFDFFYTKEERENWFQRLDEFFKQKSEYEENKQ